MNIWVSYTFKTIWKKFIQKPLNRSWALATRSRIRSPNHTCFDVMWSESSYHWHAPKKKKHWTVTDSWPLIHKQRKQCTTITVRIQTWELAFFSEIQNQKKWNVTAGYVGSCSTRVNKHQYLHSARGYLV